MEKSKKAIVIGALGQDGSFMCDVLLENGYEVFGVVKPNTDDARLKSNITYLKEDITDFNTIKKILSETNPTHVYNFMGITDVFDPWSNADIVYNNNFLTPLKIIEAIKVTNPKVRFLQASSALVFGESLDSPQNESTPRNPIYHYGLAKNFTDMAIKVYREKFDSHFCSAIFYNHESEKRGDNFFTKKVIKSAIDVKEGRKEFVELGDLESYRDMGYAKDYMYACLKIMEHDIADDYIVSTGVKTKMLDIVKLVFNRLDLSMDKHLVIKDNLKRNVGLSHLIGDNSKLKKLGWTPTNSIEDIINKMIDFELNASKC